MNKLQVLPFYNLNEKDVSLKIIFGQGNLMNGGIHIYTAINWRGVMFTSISTSCVNSESGS